MALGANAVAETALTGRQVSMTKRIGRVDSRQRCPRAERSHPGNWQSAPGSYGMEVIGFQDGFQGW
jgi:hypothetical protein